MGGWGRGGGGTVFPLLFRASVDSWSPRGLWLGLKNGSGEGQWCKVLSLSNCIHPPHRHSSLSVEATVMWTHERVFPSLLLLWFSSVFSGRPSGLRCVLFALLLPARYPPMQASHWLTFLFIFFPPPFKRAYEASVTVAGPVPVGPAS